MPTVTDPEPKPTTPGKKSSQRVSEAEIIKASLTDKVEHLTAKIERLKKLPREQVGESLRRAEETLAKTKESLK
jgi:hypothetical protein